MEQNELYSKIISGQHFVLTNEGFYEMSYNARPIGRQHEALNSIHETVKVDAGVIGEVAGCPTVLTVANATSTHITTTQLNKLKLNTCYEVIEREGSKWLSPTFNNVREDNTNNLSLDWIVPENMSLFITFIMKKNGPNYTPENAYLYAQYECKATTYILPVSNVYEDSRICFGESFVSGKSALKTCQDNLNLFYATPWNRDISSDNHGCSINFFRYDIETNEQLEILGDPENNSSSFSHSVINEINHLQLSLGSQL